ncbi:chaperonin 10-like protein [Schizophyllum amplum]|uniref:Chaperonin 10-like protein n=1 Tax=Schizophyllum amplum TaxID=97359 RepID=A0A550CYJ2_9AGAR|nr:chaperonin 10-like protein [Auriculariopsis ampla]
MPDQTVPDTQIGVLVGVSERTLTTVPVGKPGPDEVLIKNIAVASNPKDWKVAHWALQRLGDSDLHVEGNDVAGIIVAVGEGVSEYKIGARVAAFSKMYTKDNKYGAYQQYTVAPAGTTFPIPNTTTFEEAATLPLAVMTASIGLFVRLGIPAPGTAESASTAGKAIIINGAASSVGAYAVQLAKRAGLFVVGTAGASKDYAKEVGADVVIDYRDYAGDAILDALSSVVGGRSTPWAFDAVTAHGSELLFARAIDKIAKETKDTTPLQIATVFDSPDDLVKQFPPSVKLHRTHVRTAYGEDEQFAASFYRKISLWLAESANPFKCNRCKVMPSGLADVGKGLELLSTGNVHGEKIVYRIADTPGLKA